MGPRIVGAVDVSVFKRTLHWGILPRWGLAVCVLSVMLGGRTATGQEQTITRPAGAGTNLFATIDPPRPTDGVRVSIPTDWTVESVDLLRFGTETVPVELRRMSDGEVEVRADRSLRGPHELVLRVRVSEATGPHTWAVHASRSTEGEVLHRQRVSIEPLRSLDESNRVLSFEDAAGPVSLRPDVPPTFDRHTSFRVALWLRTTGRNEVVLSTWSGDEAEAYPLELLVDRSGRLRLYSGRPGAHRALWTPTPVADGKWHHAAAVYDADRARLRLMLDGTTVDSLQNHRLPVPPGSVPMALGGRPGAASRGDGPGEAGFSGRLDGVHLSNQIQSPERAQRAAPLENHETGRRLDFDEAVGTSEGPEVALEWPEGVRRVPSTRPARSPLRNVRAQSDDASVTLRWTAPLTGGSRFLIERSTDRESFSPIARLRPEQARRGATEGLVEYAYTDPSMPERVVFYRIRQERENGAPRTTATIKVGVGASVERDTGAVSLLDNFPNPFRETTTIAYEVHEPIPVTVSVWTVTGTRIRTVVDRHHKPGHYEEQFRASSLPSGPYFIQLKTPRGTQSNRMVVLK